MILPKALIFFLIVPFVIGLNKESNEHRRVQRNIRPPGNVFIDTCGEVEQMIGLILVIQNSIRNNGPYPAAITISKGKLSIDQAAKNIWATLKMLKKTNIPIFAGENSTLIPDNTIDCPSYYGNDGFGDVLHSDHNDPPKVQKMDAVTALVTMTKVMKGDAQILVLGSLTNIASAYRVDYKFIDRIKHLVVVGGSIFAHGDCVAGRQYNAYNDPFALKIVLPLTSYKNTYLMPIELSIDSTLSLAAFKKLFLKLNSPLHEFIEKILGYWIQHKPKYPTMLTPLAVALFLNRELIKEEKPLLITSSISRDARGAILVDWDNKDQHLSNVMVPFKVAYEKYYEFYSFLFEEKEEHNKN